ncbi:E3 ubiquitin-protein ligase CIP8-like [Rutidosis leptorrhynchoides]|uniref:E3 ubiquitin-protein ligase CIP8-like n=1 Tax=Rutidosis leptorrhynchoides TaxID=125765 RepID=UPI003A99FADC
MADTSPPPPSASPPAISNNSDPTQYWCYQCDKQVPIETRPDHPDLICFECKNGFVESISTSHHAGQSDDEDSPAFGDEFLQVLRLIAHAAHEVDAPPPPPLDHPVDNTDHLRIEIDELNNNNEDEEHEQHESDDNNDNDVIVDEDEDDEDVVRREARDALRIRLRDFASRAASRRNRILDWADLLMGLEDQSIELGLQVQGGNGYIGNPGDYVDETGYENLLNNLMENDTGHRKCAPPAAKSVVEGLQTVDFIKSTDVELCAVCKDSVFNNEGKIVKQLECGHMYHGECIVPWLDERNTCPVCRFELPTDDLEYEEDKKKKLKSVTMNNRITDNGCSSSSSGGD